MCKNGLISSKIKIFLDGADRSSIIEMASDPSVQGFTTNPSLMKKAGVKNYREFCQEVLTHINGKPISFEVFADDFSEMKRQALEIASWEKDCHQVYVKIPISNSRGESSTSLIRELSDQGIRLNVTALMTHKQVLETCLAVSEGAPAIVSVFAGRVADTGRDPVSLMQFASELARCLSPKIEVLWASSREALNFVQAQQVGCHIITAPLDLIKKLNGFHKDLTQLSLETVQQFKKDAIASGFEL